MTASVLLITYLTDLFEAAVSMQIFFSGSDASIQPAWGLVGKSGYIIIDNGPAKSEWQALN